MGQLATIGTNIGNVLRGSMYEQPQRRFDNRRILQQMAVEQAMREHQIQQDQQRMALAQNADARAATLLGQQTAQHNQNMQIGAMTLGSKAFEAETQRLAGEGASNVTAGTVEVGPQAPAGMGKAAESMRLGQEQLTQARLRASPGALVEQEQRDKQFKLQEETLKQRDEASQERSRLAELRQTMADKTANRRLRMSAAAQLRDEYFTLSESGPKDMRAHYAALYESQVELLDKWMRGEFDEAEQTSTEDTETLGETITLGQGENTVKLRPKNRAEAMNMRNKGGR